jgi:hypothetical protein
MAHDLEVVGSNPNTVYWMDVSDASYYINIQENNKNKDSQMGHTKKILRKKKEFTKQCAYNIITSSTN